MTDPTPARAGYDRAVAALRDVARRTGSPAARWSADYLAADPDRQAPAPANQHANHDRPVITIDPRLKFGRPQIKGISTDAIAGMVRAGEPLATVAAEYDLSVHEVILACWWEAQPGQRYRREWHGWADRVAPALGGWEPLDVDVIEEPPARGADG